MDEKPPMVGLHSEIEGRIMIDDGAKDAMLYRGKSLLAVGIKKKSKHHLKKEPLLQSTTVTGYSSVKVVLHCLQMN